MINLESVKNETRISKDLPNKKLLITRAFNADINLVWRAWTESSLLDKWWAPKPWRTETKTMDFRDGGKWLYAMIGPDGTKSWCCVDFITIKLKKSILCDDYFCDEEGVENKDFPQMSWLTKFESASSGSKIFVTISFDKQEDLEKIVEMGFEAGFTMGLSNLDELLLTAF
jgi:uncharacterized protein YndB with AHSA1/START domain